MLDRAVKRHLNLCRFLTLIFACAVALIGCETTAQPAQPIPPTPAALMLLRDHTFDANSPAQTATLFGVLLLKPQGAALVDSVLLQPDHEPQAIEGTVPSIWLGANLLSGVPETQQRAGYAIVQLSGRIDGPGAYGPERKYRYQMQVTDFKTVAVEERSIPVLLSDPVRYENQLVSLSGGLLIRDGAALLVDRLGPGGVPVSKARQIKLNGRIQDQHLLAALSSGSGGLVRFGDVQIEGFWHDGMFTPLVFNLNYVKKSSKTYSTLYLYTG